MFIKSLICVAVIFSASVAGVPHSLRCDETGCQHCQLKKLPEFTYKCQTKNDDYGDCDDYVAINTSVKVTPNTVEGDTDKTVSVKFPCTKDGIFNISLECVEEMKKLQNEFKDLSIPKIKNPFDSLNPANPKLEKMSPNFIYFQNQIIAKLNQMHEKIAECDIYMNVLKAYLVYQEPPNETTQRCELPQHPENGRYNVAMTNKWLPSGLLMKVVKGLEYECNPGFVLVGTANPQCVNASWQNEFPRCSAACKLEKKSKFNYQCPDNNTNNESCGEYVAVGSVVRVSRRQDSNTAPVTVSITCLNDGTFNLSTTCVQEIDALQMEFENPTMEKITAYESEFREFKHNDASVEFHRLVEEFHIFEKYVYDNLRDMHKMADECDIYLDLILPG